jgi:hypothetical protein
MNWKDTVFKQSQIKWKNPKFKYVDDNNIDLILTIPITNLLEQQARQSFTQGVFEMLKHIASTPTDGSVNVSQLLKEKFIEWGLPQKAIDSIVIPKEKK